MHDGEKELNSEFLIGILRNSVNHINFMKKQQWTITYYCLLIYAAVIGLCRLFQFKLECWERILLALISFILCIVSYWLVGSFFASISEHRQIVSKIYKQYPLECRKAGIDLDKKTQGYDRINIILRTTIVVGLFVVVWVFLRTKGT